MLTHDRLSDLYENARSRHVLSVYIDGEQRDPAERRVWRTRLERALSECRSNVESNGRAELSDFDTARDRLMERLRDYSNFMPERGWVGFATTDDVVYADTVPVPMPDLVVWEEGLRVAPYVRALKQERPVVLALADRHHAKVLVYREGDIEEVEEFTAGAEIDDLSDTQTARRSAERSGTRGNATDDAQRQVELKAEALLDRTVGRVAELAGAHGLVVIGGTRETGKRLLHTLPNGLETRTMEVGSLHLDMSRAELKTHAEGAASEITQRLQDELVDRVLDQARSGGKGVLGDEDTAAALLERKVDTLVLTRNFLSEHPDRSDHMVGTAFEQRADVEEVSGPGAERLDEEAGGVGALLRW
ncbi:MAG TPA: hypothetical protein VJ925_09890 [Longimicrobiales bacterium]|nr:hypothetical protein [Longimicrobiales bacterium]